MTLQLGSLFNSDATGSQETITLEPSDPKTTTQATFGPVFYGTDSQGSPQQIPTNDTSLTITVLKGINPLAITLVSPEKEDETVLLKQGNTLLLDPTIRNHSTVCTIVIKGT
jgi:hypothetical protein